VSQWGGRMDFEVAAGPPPPVTKLSPNGEVQTFTPTFEWEADPSADEYFILVRDSDTMSGPARIAIWLTPQETNCPDGTGTCSWTADTDLAAGDARWWARAANAAGTSIWGGSMDFEVAAGPPPAVTKLAPEGEMVNTKPTFEWEAVSSADEYLLLVRDSETMDGPARISRWLSPEQVDCTDGTGTCLWTDNIALAPGEARWWVRARNDLGTSIWGGFFEFEVEVSDLDDYTFSLVVSDDESSINELKFGVREFLQGISAPPSPPEGALHAYFTRGGEELFEDYRGNQHQNRIWNLNYSIGAGSELTIEWSEEGFHGMGSLTIRDTSGNVLANMTQTSEFTFSPATYPSLRIEYRMD